MTATRKTTRPRKTSVPVPTESAEAKALVKWWTLAARVYGIPENALLHVPNEGKRSPVMGKKLKDEGLRPGTPDYFLAVPRSPYSGLWIELKRRRGATPSDNQREMLAMLESQSYAVNISYGAEQAIHAIQEYLRQRINEKTYE